MGDSSNQFIGDIPKFYDECLGPVIFENYARDLAERAAALKPTCVLELAAGTGLVSRKLRDALAPNARLVVTDLSESMLSVARSKFRTDEAVDFAPADAMKLDYPDNSFDLIVCQFGVMFFPDKVAAFREARRVLQPGKPYLFNVWGSMEENPFSLLAYDMSAKFFPDDPPGFYRVPFSYPDPAIVVADMEAAGFAEATYETVPLQTQVKSWPDFARGIVFGNPLASDIANRDGAAPEEVMDFIERRYRDMWGGEPTTMPLKAYVFVGKAP